MDEPIDHLDIKIYGARNFPLGQVRIPGSLIPNFQKLLVQAQEKNPVYSAPLLVRWMVKLGYKGVAHSIRTVGVEANPGGE